MLQPKKSKDTWQQEKEWLQDWYTNRMLPDPALNQEYQNEKSSYVKTAKKLPTPNFVTSLEEGVQGEYDRKKKKIDIINEADPLVYTHEGSHAINLPLKDTKSSFTAFDEIGKNILPVDKIQNKWVKDNYPEISNYQEVISRLNSYRQLHGLKPDQEITPELIKQNRDSYNAGDIPFEDNTDQLYKLFEDEGLSNVLNKVVSNTASDDTTFAAYGTGKKGTMKRKKYALGTPGIENPSTTIAKNNIMIAQAEQDAQSNPWAAIALMAGQIGSQAIGNTITNSRANAIEPEVNALGNSGTGGNAEVEGKEVLELPTGQVAEVKGASHENGGVNMNLPEGTKIYSKRIEKFGETMAERKKIRERKKLNLDKLLETGKSDIAVRNAHQRTMQSIEAEEAEDLKTQEMFGVMAAVQEFAYGTNKDGTPKYANGGITGFDPVTGKFIKPDITGQELNPIPFTTPDNLDYLNLGAAPQQDLPQGTLTMKQLQKDNAVDLPGNVVSRAVEKADISVPGAGDAIGIFGDLYSAFQPMKNTLAARAGDTPNVNSFKDFGKDAIEANMASMETALGLKDSASRKITASANASKRAGRNSARGVNQQRALDLATDINVNEANQSATDSFSRTMMELLGQKSSLENVQDQAVMTGEASRDLADRQDRDNFYTQMSKDIATKGQGIQTVGKDINAIKQNEMANTIVNQLSKYGLAFDAKGNLIQIPQTK